ncbi:hypothetical protein TNCV_4879031 [Trichonephila clavipes]|nr:hypothetical protein TNCV_4879031 [Trichonephila clavipes]
MMNHPKVFQLLRVEVKLLRFHLLQMINYLKIYSPSCKKKSRTPKEKITHEKTKKPPQKRNLTEEASDRKLSPVRKLSRKSDDNSASTSNTPRNNTYNPVGVNRSLVEQIYVEPSPVPVLDMSRPNPIVRAKKSEQLLRRLDL